ncbi:hypothetical protein BRCON_0355 [Candidatus Sumerlaea chitinivorans]|uniref:Uncharacterized protein n=1 Tax=Sumerlaea chitinivorans TaxID=2250252 RepID=A0A2Z4Y324_SUMC1|nr:hypothetical protein BRCON_0355 [Candidatus Sumerlaea chitinivorans]
MRKSMSFRCVAGKDPVNGPKTCVPYTAVLRGFHRNLRDG